MKSCLFLGALMAFSVSASAAETENMKESTAQSVKVKSAQSASRLPQVDSGILKVVRKSVDKKERTSNQAKTGVKRSSKLRAKDLQKSQNSASFSIYDAWINFDLDFDADGFYSEFTVGFDPDVAVGTASVYAEVYISQNGGDWEFLGDTEDFVITQDETDEILVSFALNSGFPTDQYDILIDLYETGFSGIVATTDPQTDADLFALPLEDADYDGNTTIDYVSSLLSYDLDHDGFYTQVTLEYDIDTVDSGRLVYSEIDIIDTHNNYRRTVATSDFRLGNQTEIVDLILESGYLDGYYDIEIRIMDSVTNEEITYAGQVDFSSLRSLPLESEEYDDYGSEVIVVHDGGGSLFYLLLPLIGLVMMRRKN